MQFGIIGNVHMPPENNAIFIQKIFSTHGWNEILVTKRNSKIEIADFSIGNFNDAFSYLLFLSFDFIRNLLIK